MLLCGMNFINLIRIRSIFGIEDQLILSYNPKMRITGSRFIEACFFIGFVPGTNQNKDLIFKRMEKIFNDKEIKYFNNGYKG